MSSGKRQIKITMNYHYTPPWMAQIAYTENTEHSGDHVEQWRLSPAVGIQKWNFWNYGRPSYTANHTLAIWLSSPVPDIYANSPREPCLHRILHLDVCSSQTQKIPRCHSMGEGINPLWYIQATHCYAVLKISEQSGYEDMEKISMCITK